MKKSLLAAYAAALASAGSSVIGAAAAKLSELTIGTKRSNNGKGGGKIGQRSKNYRATGRRYPEQSARQAMRGARRAQGGPGLTEGPNPMPRTGVWLKTTRGFVRDYASDMIEA